MQISNPLDKYTFSKFLVLLDHFEGYVLQNVVTDYPFTVNYVLCSRKSDVPMY